MKLASKLTLGLVLALGTSGLTGYAPALAAKEKPAKGPSVNLSKEFRAAMTPVEAAITAKTYDGLLPKIDAIAATATLPDEKFYVGYKRFDVAKALNDTAQQRKGVLEMIGSQSALTTNLAQLNVAAGQLAYNIKDYPDAAARLSEAVRLGSKEPDTLILLAEANFQQNKYAEGLGYAEQAIAAKSAGGTKAPEDWYRRPLTVAYKAKMYPAAAKFSRLQLAAYPSADNWRTALVLYRDSAKLEGQQQLDLFRLMRQTKSVAGERDFYEYASLASERGLPGEAKSVIEEGMATGAIGKTVRPINELLAVSSAKVAGDMASLGASEKQAGSRSDGKLAAGTADAYLGYGQDAKAVPLYKLALQKGGVDTDAVNTRLGIALARQGLKAEARTAFGAVNGPRADIAKYWLTWLDLNP